MEARKPTVYIETTEVEKVDKIRDSLVAQMEKLGAEKYQQKKDQELRAVLKEIDLRTKPAGKAAVVITEA